MFENAFREMYPPERILKMLSVSCASHFGTHGHDMENLSRIYEVYPWGWIWWVMPSKFGMNDSYHLR